MGRLVQGLIDQDLSQAADRRRPIGRRLELSQLDPQREAKLVKGVASRGGPLLVAVLGQQLAVVGVERRSIGDGVAFLSRARGGLLEGDDVDPNRIVRAKRHHVLVQLQVAVALTAGRVERASRRKDRLMQIVSGRGRIAARPKQLGGLVRVQALLRREREQLDQGLRLAQSPSVIGDGVTAQGD